jgi:hypothetical protein
MGISANEGGNMSENIIDCDHRNNTYEPADYWCGIPNAAFICDDCGGVAPAELDGDCDGEWMSPVWDLIEYGS